MNNCLSSLHGMLVAWGKARSMRVGGPVLLTLLAILLTGCATCPPGPTRTEISRVPQPVWLPIPERYIEPLGLPSFDLDQEGRLGNSALEVDTSLLEDLLDRALQDREELRRLNQQRGQHRE